MSSSNRSVWLVTWIFVIQLLVVIILIDGDWTNSVMERETSMVKSTLGQDSYLYIKKKADYWYNETAINTGIKQELYNILIPTKEQVAKSRGMEKMGSKWFIWVEGRIEAFFDVLYQFYKRLALVLLWLPYMLIIFIPAIYDGYLKWRIKRTNFDYSSTLLHAYAFKSMKFIFLGTLILFFIPYPVSPVYAPIVMIICSMLIGLAISNHQKRI